MLVRHRRTDEKSFIVHCGLECLPLSLSILTKKKRKVGLIIDVVITDCVH